jgi:hypothetical protein
MRYHNTAVNPRNQRILHGGCVYSNDEILEQQLVSSAELTLLRWWYLSYSAHMAHYFKNRDQKVVFYGQLRERIWRTHG